MPIDLGEQRGRQSPVEDLVEQATRNGRQHALAAPLWWRGPAYLLWLADAMEEPCAAVLTIALFASCFACVVTIIWLLNCAVALHATWLLWLALGYGGRAMMRPLAHGVRLFVRHALVTDRRYRDGG